MGVLWMEPPAPPVNNEGHLYKYDKDEEGGAEWMGAIVK